MRHDRHTGEPLKSCMDCKRLFTPSSAALGSDYCPTCTRRRRMEDRR